MKPARQPRIVLDTNVAVSAFLWGGKPSIFIALAGAGEVRLFNSRALLDELERTLAKPRLARPLLKLGIGAGEILDRYRLICDVVRPKPLAGISRDPDDDHVIACALAARADVIITGDDDLLVLKTVGSVRIASVADMLADPV